MYLIIVPLLSILGVGFTLSKRLKVPAAFAPIITCSLFTILLYLGGIINILNVATYGIAAIGTSLFIGEFVLSLKKKDFSDWGQLPFIFLTISYILFVLIYWRWTVWGNDDFSHWAFAPKEMLHTGSLLLPSNTIAHFKEYIPGPILWSYFFVKIASYKEGFLYVAKATLMISGMIAFMEGMKLTSWKRGSLLFLFLYVFFNFLGHGAFLNLYVDVRLGVFFGVLLYLAYAYKEHLWKKTFLALPIIALLTLTKQMGLILSIAAIIMLAVNMFLEKHKFRRILVATILMLAVPLMITISWKYYIRIHDIPNVFNFEVVSFFQNLKGNLALEHNQFTIKNFIWAFFSETITPLKFTDYITVTPFAFLLLLSGFYIIKLSAIVERGARIRWNVNFTLLFLGFLGYSILLLVIYLISFSVRERVILASYERYITPYLIGWGSVVLVECIFNNNVQLSKIKWARTFYVLSLFLIAFLSFKKSTKPFRTTGHKLLSGDRPTVKAVTQELNKNQALKNKKIYCIFQGSGVCSSQFFYELDYRDFDATFASIKDPKYSNPRKHYLHESFDKKISRKDWYKELQNYDYVVIGKASEEFWLDYGSAFQDNNYTFYEIIKDPKTGNVSQLKGI